MTYKRSKLELYLEVLDAIDKGTRKPTRIMYRTNLSWKPLMKILEYLQDQSLIKCEKKGSSTIYRITDKGKNALEYLSRALKLIERNQMILCV